MARGEVASTWDKASVPTKEASAGTTALPGAAPKAPATPADRVAADGAPTATAAGK